MNGFKIELMGMNKNAMFASTEGNILLENKERIESKVSVAVVRKLVRTIRHRRLMTFILFCEPDFCIISDIFTFRTIIKQKIIIIMNTVILLTMYTIENGGVTELPTAMHMVFCITLNDRNDDRTGGSTAITAVQQHKITALPKVNPYRWNGFHTIHMNRSNAIKAVDVFDIATDIII